MIGPKGATKIKTLDVLEAVPLAGTRIVEVARALGVKSIQISGHITYLVSKGWIQREGRGVVARTPAGSALVVAYRLQAEAQSPS